MNPERIQAYLQLNSIEHSCNVVWDPLFERGLDVEEIVQLNRLALEEFFSKQKVTKILKHRSSLSLSNDLDYILENKIGLLPIEDPDYPPLLREIYNPPRLLYYLGQLPPSDALHVAMVGAREASVSGKCLAEEIGSYLATHGISVVSGLARGIDRSSHLGVFRKKGYAVGVVASGLSEYLKPRPGDLVEGILKNGIIFSEFPVKSKAYKKHFPMRNRIITGMSKATIIVEAKIRSGSMISARLTLEQGRELLACPGPMHSELSQGTNSLIRDGAHLISKPEDILDDLGIEAAAREVIQYSETEREVVSHLGKEPVAMDELLYKTQMPMQKLSLMLLDMEKKGILRMLPGQNVCLVD